MVPPFERIQSKPFDPRPFAASTRLSTFCLDQAPPPGMASPLTDSPRAPASAKTRKGLCSRPAVRSRSSRRKRVSATAYRAAVAPCVHAGIRMLDAPEVLLRRHRQPGRGRGALDGQPGRGARQPARVRDRGRGAGGAGHRLISRRTFTPGAASSRSITDGPRPCPGPFLPPITRQEQGPHSGPGDARAARRRNRWVEEP